MTNCIQANWPNILFMAKKQEIIIIKPGIINWYKLVQIGSKNGNVACLLMNKLQYKNKKCMLFYMQAYNPE